MRIEGFQFGRITVEGQLYTKDIKICRDQVICPWWRKSGHRVEVSDVQDCVESGPEWIVLGRGEPGMMQASPALKKYLQDRGIALFEASTQEAVREYARLLGQGKEVCLGLHLFC